MDTNGVDAIGRDEFVVFLDLDIGRGIADRSANLLAFYYDASEATPAVSRLAKVRRDKEGGVSSKSIGKFSLYEKSAPLPDSTDID